MNLRAYAKINPGLDVTGTRADGYHEVRMIMQTVDLYDEISLEACGGGEIICLCSRDDLPCDDRNLAVRAASLLVKQFDISSGIKIRLNKNIPVAAGLAGGSSDAAAVLIGISRLFRLNLQERELARLAVQIGADVPYCLMGGTALAEGIGEILTPLPDLPECPIVIAKPAVSVSTGYVYQNLDLAKTEHPDIDGMQRAIGAGDLPGVTERLGNVLESVSEPAFPVIREVKKNLREHGASGVLMSGSGPTVFGIFPDCAAAECAADELRRSRSDLEIVSVTRPVKRSTVNDYHTGEQLDDRRQTQ
ncbi:MAG: 4-(cytidine 5'-diphospho)-2-C-methyl-D-erythritol kinase [Lachnospiraceae bacterium]|jgi:4-diphosphocytidyl-2-C-methyl-D-erythritol kinase|nr:4-(cytidine 5'-diphospho)-2-C-methyl-D-erythritol kinase [Lachnospiraceae bacterium]MCI1327607.1 4-(cytidine 5'-diphospho)-2-C-methyl-D-erythritol kinase [Lachnospiraceae bacterium]